MKEFKEIEKITSKEELENYMENLELAGQGGTDFRPVFAYIQKLPAKKELTGLKGLLYFTDGQGIFPDKMPPYDTAFILMQKDYQEVEITPVGNENLYTGGWSRI